jgi:hypothetical protein
MLLSLVIIDDLDIEYVAILEVETNTPLVVHPDAPLPFAISPQGFQTTARWRAKKIQRGRRVQLRQFAFGNCLNARKRLGLLPSNSAWVPASSRENMSFNVDIFLFCSIWLF